MSYDLFVYYTSHPQTHEEAMDAYHGFLACADVSPYIESSSKIATFFAELQKRFPPLEQLSEDDCEKSLWSGSAVACDSHVSMAFRASASDEDVESIVDLVDHHGLVCLDPQVCGMICAPDGIYIGSTD